MSNPILERNLVALMRVNETLARAMIDYGGGTISDVLVEEVEWPTSPQKTRLCLAGLVDPCLLRQRCDDGWGVTVYCDRLNELMYYLSHQDLRSHLFSGSLNFVLGVWHLAGFEESQREDFIFTSSYARQVFWARRAGNLPEKPSVIVADGGLFVDDIGSAFVELDYCPHLVNLEDLPAELWPRRDELAPGFVCSVNDRRGVEVFAQSLGAKCLVWQIDPDLNEERINFPENLFVGWYKPLEHPEAQRRYLPLATNPSRRVARDEPCSGISFVGSSMKTTGQSYQTCFVEHLQSLGVSREEANSRVIAFRDAICLEESRYSRRLVLDVFPELGNGIVRCANQELGIDATIWLGEYLAWQWRTQVVQSLASPIQLWGDEGWRELSSEGVTFRGRCGHGEALSTVYGQSLINLDIGRVYQEEIVTMRVFDVLASKRFILTPHTPALAELFEVGREIETYQSLSDLQDKIDYYLANPGKAHEIAQLGYRRVIKDHQITQRLASLIAWASA